MISTEDVLDYIEETGSTWMKTSERNEREPNLVYREVNNELFVTHKFYKDLELKCSMSVVSMLKEIPREAEKIEKYIKDFETLNKFSLAEEQKAGVRMMCSYQIGILTGGPGTGKTSVLKCAKYVLEHIDIGKTFAFTAPTGKAARTIKEGAGFDAITIQKKIHDTGDDEIPLQKVREDYLFIDEASMLGIETFSKVLLCLGKNTHLFLIGDVEQLPSVSEGAVLRDLIDSGIIPCVQLEKTFRQDNSSKLFENIQIIKQGCYIPLEEGNDFLRIKTEDDVFKICVKRYLENVEKYGIEQTVLLSPYRKAGKVCSKKLNSYLQKAVNPNGKVLRTKVNRDGTEETIEFKEGDPVIHLQNREEVANGDTGIVTKVTKGTVTVKYTDCEIVYDNMRGDLEDLDLAYALSINKSQGSEYKCVIVPILEEFTNLNKNMIYTAVTRSKSICEVIGHDKTIMTACKKQASHERTTFFREEIELSLNQMALISQILSA